MPAKARERITRKLETIPIKTFIDDYLYRVDLDADYQREKIWSREDQERLIDSIIQNIDIPKLYLAEIHDKKNFDYECIDGKQRMATFLNFFKPEESADSPLTVKVAGEKYTYKQLRAELPSLARKIDEYELTFVVYPQTDDDAFLREIFRRLQLGVRLNSGELLKSHMGTIRDFVYTEMGKEAPFLKKTKLSEKRFSRQFTLAQICINSFSKHQSGDFVRARYEDLEDFFKENYNLVEDDENLRRIRSVLKVMEKSFGQRAESISSRAVAVSAYLFCEQLFLQKRQSQIDEFARFYEKLLHEIKENLKLLTRFKSPTNSTVLEEFQKYISQASVESYAIKRRHLFLENGFEYFTNPKTRGTIIGAK
ncbi:MAG TPA: DUF262 domain-containing protein [Candidatus Sulfotelmatobacter sp.]|nr:DUF262 domain-containing protein [Candidatus Sulfotelmatobacter sp.]